MNERQRKFLTEHVNKTYQAEKKKIEEERPGKPSMNNHVISAILNKTLKIHDSELILKKLLERTLKLTKKDKSFVKEDEDYNYRLRETTYTKYIEVPPEDLFEMPDTYQEEMRKYKESKLIYDKKLDDLEARHNTIVLKVQVGSAANLEKLVMQIDNLGSLDLIGNQLLLGAGTVEERQKAIGPTK